MKKQLQLLFYVSLVCLLFFVGLSNQQEQNINSNLIQAESLSDQPAIAENTNAIVIKSAAWADIIEGLKEVAEAISWGGPAPPDSPAPGPGGPDGGGAGGSW